MTDRALPAPERPRWASTHAPWKCPVCERATWTAHRCSWSDCGVDLTGHNLDKCDAAEQVTGEAEPAAEPVEPAETPETNPEETGLPGSNPGGDVRESVEFADADPDDDVDADGDVLPDLDDDVLVCREHESPVDEEPIGDRVGHWCRECGSFVDAVSVAALREEIRSAGDVQDVDEDDEPALLTGRARETAAPANQNTLDAWGTP